MSTVETPVAVGDLSSVSWSYSRLDVGPTWRVRGYEALCVTVAGHYGVGSSGRNDALVIRMALVSGWMLWRADALLIDITDLDYVWGDDLFAVLEIGSDPLMGATQVPVAVQCSEMSLSAVRSLAAGIGHGPVPIITSDRDQALVKLGKSLATR